LSAIPPADRVQRSRRYLLGMGAVALLTIGFLASAPLAWRPALWLALGLGLLVQAPLGTWLLVSLGSDRFLPVWVLGMLTRLAVIGFAALVLFPTFDWPAGPGLVTLALILMASLSLESLVLLFEFRRESTAR
jgi:4-amino-4-deoxy-L-arabinose transferase-like glycosyltransferase